MDVRQFQTDIINDLNDETKGDYVVSIGHLHTLLNRLGLNNIKYNKNDLKVGDIYYDRDLNTPLQIKVPFGGNDLVPLSSVLYPKKIKDIEVYVGMKYKGVPNFRELHKNLPGQNTIDKTLGNLYTYLISESSASLFVKAGVYYAVTKDLIDTKIPYSPYTIPGEPIDNVRGNTSLEKTVTTIIPSKRNTIVLTYQFIRAINISKSNTDDYVKENTHTLKVIVEKIWPTNPTSVNDKPTINIRFLGNNDRVIEQGLFEHTVSWVDDVMTLKFKLKRSRDSNKVVHPEFNTGNTTVWLTSAYGIF